VFYAFDDVTKTSYVKDLGITFASFVAAPSYSGSPNNISSDANWASYLTSVGNDTSNTYWGVFASLKTGATGANTQQLITTARNNTVTNTQSSLTRGIDGSFNTTYLGNLQGNGTNYAANLSYFSASTGSDNWAIGLQHNLAGKITFNADNVIGQNADMFKLSTASLGTSPAVVSTLLATPTQWSFDGNTLQIAAVPEPETYGMLVAGLMMLGAVARRRRV
jgi:hypothetical protein